jgi:hypothetical protein
MATLPKSNETVRHLDATMGFFTDDEWVVVEKSFSLWKEMVLRLMS